MPKRSRAFAISQQWQAAKRRRYARRRYYGAAAAARYANAYASARVPTRTTTTGPFATRIFTTVKYSDVIALTGGGAGLGAEYQFNLNSIYDPDRTGTGHQPYGHDQLNSLYNRYRVWSCRYRITPVNKNNGNSASIINVIPNNSTSSLASTAANASEYPGAKTLVVSSVAPNPLSINGRVSLPNLVGQSKQEYAGEGENATTFGTSPTSTCILHITGYPSDVANTLAAYFHVDLTYYVEVFDINQLGQS